MAKGLFGAVDVDKVITIWDSTYVYIQKSGNNVFKRKAFSGHKHRPLVKPFSEVAPNRHIIEVFGSYEANTSDAQIMEHLFEKEISLISCFKEGDVFLVDKGFRDVVPFFSRRVMTLRCLSLLKLV